MSHLTCAYHQELSYRNEGGEASVGWSLFCVRAGVAGLKVRLHVFSLGLPLHSDPRRSTKSEARQT